MPNNGSRYHAEVKVSVEGHDCRVNVFADTLQEIFADIGTLCAHFPKEWAPAPSFDEIPSLGAPRPRTPTGKGAQPMSANGRPLPPNVNSNPDGDDLPSEVPTCVHCGQWDGMELIKFTSKKDGKPRRAWKCQACDQWHFPEKKGK